MNTFEMNKIDRISKTKEQESNETYLYSLSIIGLVLWPHVVFIWVIFYVTSCKKKLEVFCSTHKNRVMYTCKISSDYTKTM